MVEVSDITSEDTLRAWLDARPGDDDARRMEAVIIAHRAAMRVLPTAWHDFQFADWAVRRELTAMPVLWCNMIGGVAGTWPTPPIKASASAARVAYASAAHAASAAAASAARAASASAASAAAASAARAASASAAYAMWDSVRRDCAMIAAGDDVMSAHLWHDHDNPMAEKWTTLREKLQSDPDAAHWAFWIDWYDRSLRGDHQDWKGLLSDVALIEQDVWEQGVAAVGARIAALQKVSAPHSAISKKSIQSAVAANARTIPVQTEALIAVLDAEIERLRGRNPCDDIAAEENSRLRQVFSDMREAIISLGDMIPTETAPSDAETEEIQGLLELYRAKFIEWPRENAADLVDSGCRTVLVGLSAGVFAACGAPALAAIGVSGLLFGGKKLAAVGKTVKDVTPSKG